MNEIPPYPTADESDDVACLNIQLDQRDWWKARALDLAEYHDEFKDCVIEDVASRGLMERLTHVLDAIEANK